VPRLDDNGQLDVATGWSSWGKTARL